MLITVTPKDLVDDQEYGYRVYPRRTAHRRAAGAGRVYTKLVGVRDA